MSGVKRPEVPMQIEFAAGGVADDESVNSSISHFEDEGQHNDALPFQLKLHQLLEDATEKGFQDIVSFHPDGKSFKIHKPHVFAETILPKYYNMSKMKSFQRQLVRMV
jgi:hypothetical protein